LELSHASVPSVFVVDDDSSLRFSLQRLFRSAGWSVQTFSSAEEFLEQPRDETRACLIADVHLGRMSGLELLAIVVPAPGALPVILITGFDGGVTETEALRLGAFAFFRKPFDAFELLRCARRAVDRGTPIVRGKPSGATLPRS
jgi:FixJ family two-component response regulator